MKCDLPFPGKCEKCIHEDVCYAVGECLNHIPDFKCDCFDLKNVWRKCYQEMPKVGEWVLCMCQAGIYEVLKLQIDNTWFHDAERIYMKHFVVRWTPIPKP